MSAKGARHRLEFLTRELSAAEWRLLAALAVERELGLSSLQRVAGALGISAGTRSAGLTRRAGAVRGATLSGAALPGAALSGAALSVLPLLQQWRDSGLLIELGKAATGALRGGAEP